MDDVPSVLMMSGITGGFGLLKMSWKRSALLALFADPVEMVLPSYFLTSLVCLLLYADIVLVIHITFSCYSSLLHFQLQWQ